MPEKKTTTQATVRFVKDNGGDHEPVFDSKFGIPADAELVLPPAPFKFVVSGNLTITVEGGELVLRVYVGESTEVHGKTLSRPLLGTMDIEIRSEIKTEEIREWAAKTLRTFAVQTPAHFALELWRMATIAAQYQIIKRGAAPKALETFIDNTAKVSSTRLKSLFWTGPRTRSPWTIYTLEASVKRAMNAILARGEKLNQGNVADEMRRLDPENAPQSGHSLGVLLTRHELSWTTLKSHTKRGENVRFLDES